MLIKEQREKFFDPASSPQQLGLDQNIEDVAHISCNYRAFTIPVAQIINGTIYVLDIETDD
jgi:hypothetical protein